MLKIRLAFFLVVFAVMFIPNVYVFGQAVQWSLPICLVGAALATWYVTKGLK